MALSIKSSTIGFEAVASRVADICATEDTFKVEQPILNLCDTDAYSEFGLKSLGKLVGFPADFIRTLAETGSKPLATKNIFDRTAHYFAEGGRPYFARAFGRDEAKKIHGVVSDRYAYFDDDEVCDIIGDSPLKDFRFQCANISPERLHLRAIDLDNSFKVEGDDSPLFLMYFVDNSMVGQASFKVRVGVYRQVCQNGMIIPMQSFILCKAVHRGRKDIAAEFTKNVAFLAAKRDEIQKMLAKKGEETAAITELREKFDEEYVKAHIKKHLNTNKSETEKIIVLFDAYSIECGRPSKWAFINAVTQFARDLPESQLERRLYLESRAMQAA